MPIYDSDMPYYIDSAFDSSSTGFTNIDPALRPEGLPPLANCFMDLEGDFVMPNIKCMGGIFYDKVEFRGEVIIDSADFNGIESIETIGNVDIGGDLQVNGNLDVDGSLQLASGTRVNSISTGVGDPGTHDVLVTEAAVRSFVESYVATLLASYATKAYSDANAVWARDQAISSANAYTNQAIANIPSGGGGDSG